MATVSEFIQNLLFKGELHTASSKSFNATTTRRLAPAFACLEARQGKESPVSSITAPKVNNLVHFVTQVENGNIKYACDKWITSGSETYVLEGLGGNSYKAMVVLNGNHLFVTAWLKHEEARASLYGGILGVLISSKQVVDRLKNFKNIFKEEIEEKKLGKAYDALYYDLKYCYPELDGEIKIEEESKLNNLLARTAAFNPLPVPDGLQEIVGGKMFPTFDKVVTEEKEPEAEEKTDSRLEKFREECLRGEYRLFEKFFTEGNEKIPKVSILSGYYFTETFRKVVMLCFNYLKHVFLLGTEHELSPFMKYEAKDQDIAPLNYHLYGPPGTGKSYLVTALGAALGVPVYEFTVTGGFEEGNFNKMPEWNESGNIFMRTQTFREGFVKGGLICMDEMNLAKPDIAMMLSGALERPYVIGQDANTARNAATIIFATSNPGTAGTKAQNNALASRFRALKIDRMSDQELLGMIRARRKSKSVQCDAAAEKRIMEVFSFMHKKFEELGKEEDSFKTIAEVVSPRSLIGCVEEYCDLGTTLEEAILSCVLNPARLAVENLGGDGELIEEFDQKIFLPVTTDFENDKVFSNTYAENNSRKGKSK